VARPFTNIQDLREFLDERVHRYEKPGFIEDDPISVPHRFTRNQDIEIAGLFAAVLAWGQRPVILRNSLEIMRRMDNKPYDFVRHHSTKDLKQLEGFVHRTFNDTDLLYFVHFLHHWYQHHDSLESLFAPAADDLNTGAGLIRFHQTFFSLPDAPARTQKHIATPERNSACKRINMFLRWMVRSNKGGVDFGIWKSIRPNQLICPIDLHVDRVARKLGLIRSKGMNWKTAVALTDRLKQLDPADPVKYDFALFGLGVIEDYAFAAARRKRSLTARPRP
jgi:uncharacterized protein (TIGR02757 family)